MTPKQKHDLQADLRRRFPGAYVAYPRSAKRQQDFHRKVDCLQTVWPGLDDYNAEQMVINETMKALTI